MTGSSVISEAPPLVALSSSQQQQQSQQSEQHLEDETENPRQQRRPRSTSFSEYSLSWEPQVAEVIRQKVQQLRHQEESRKRNDSGSNSINDDDDLKKTVPRPLMVALTGLPGSGKSISGMLLAHALEQPSRTSTSTSTGTSNLNYHHYHDHYRNNNDSNPEDENKNHDKYNESTTTATLATAETRIGCFVMPHDGYHMSLSQLRLTPNPADMIYRRGAPDTFEPHVLLRDLKRLRGDVDENSNWTNYDGYPYDLSKTPNVPEDVIKIPAFDHARGDPEPDKHIFDRSIHQVVLCEGLYLLHDADGWQDVASMFDLRIFIDTDLEECMERVKIRNLCIPGYTPEEIRERVDRVDRVNAHTVLHSKPRADLIVQGGVTTTVVSPATGTVTTIHEDMHHNIEDPYTDPYHGFRVESSVSLAALDLETHAVDKHFPETSTAVITDDYNYNDWAMDLITRPRGDSWVSTSSTSLANAAERAPTISEPIGHIVGRWEPEMVQRIITMVQERQNSIDKTLVSPSLFSTSASSPPPPPLPLMVALVAAPGTGKSLSAMVIASQLEESGYPCMVMPHDGYHYPLEHLRTFPHAADAIYRRGAPDTFDPVALLRDLKRIRGTDGWADHVEDIIKVPGFDHARGDPEPDTHIFDRHRHVVVLCEGLYLLHDQDGWEEVADQFDLKIFMNASIDTCMERVKLRNTCIPGYTPEEIAIRVEQVDRINALTVVRSKKRADVIVETMA